MKTLANLKWALLIPASLLSAMAFGCSSEPVVVEKIVEVEVVKEVVVEKEMPVEGPDIEATVEARVAAALATAVPEAAEAVQDARTSNPTATPPPTNTPPPIPTSTPIPTAVLLVRPSDIGYTHMSAIAFSEGIPVDVVVGATSRSIYRDFYEADTIDIDPSRYRGAFVTHTPGPGLLSNVHAFVYSGGNAVVLLNICLARDLQEIVGITCANMPNRDYTVKGLGERFAPFWNGLTIDGGPYFKFEVQLLPGQSDFSCIQWTHPETGKFCTALYGKVGDGNIIFMVSRWANKGVPGRPHYRYAKSILDDGLIFKYDHKEAALRLLRWLVQDPASGVLPANASFDAASVLARFSTTDPMEGEARADAAGQIIAQYTSGKADTTRVLDLLHTVAPELSIDERTRAADELASLSDDDRWDEAETARVVFYLGSVITGDEPNPDERIEAANEMVILYEAGELDADNALDLMNTIAPGLSIDERRQAAGALATLSADDDWDDADRMAAASEVFRLVTGVPLAAEQRIGAAVDLTGVGVKVFDTDDQFDDRDIDNATAIIKQSLTGELSAESLQSILGSDD